MNYQLRKKEILARLSEKDEVEVLTLADELGVSGITIRRDLDKLDKEGLALRTHGGATKNIHAPIVSFSKKAIQYPDEKEHICRIAASLIKEGDVVFIDCGSTTFGLCRYINKMNIKVITNSLPVLNALAGTSVSINMIGGEFDKKRMAIHGKRAVDHINQYQASKAFIGVDAFSIEKGLSSNSETESSISLAMAKNSAETILLCDSSKINKLAYYSFAPVTLINTLITNQPIELSGKLKKPGIEVLF